MPRHEISSPHRPAAGGGDPPEKPRRRVPSALPKWKKNRKKVFHPGAEQVELIGLWAGSNWASVRNLHRAAMAYGGGGGEVHLGWNPQRQRPRRPLADFPSSPPSPDLGGASSRSSPSSVSSRLVSLSLLLVRPLLRRFLSPLTTANFVIDIEWTTWPPLQRAP
jgi:hypothetical protein